VDLEDFDSLFVWCLFSEIHFVTAWLAINRNALDNAPSQSSISICDACDQEYPVV